MSKTRHVEFKFKLNDLSENIKLISTIGLTKDLINDYSVLNSWKYFSSNGLNNYLVFIAVNKYFSFIEAPREFINKNLKKMSEETIKNLSIPDNSLAPKWIDKYGLPEVKFNENCLRKDKMLCLFFIKI